MQLYATAGNTIEIDVDITNRDGEPINLDGSSFTFNAITTDARHLITKTELDGIEVDEDVVGRLHIRLDPEDTIGFTRPKNLHWDVEMTDVFDVLRTVAKGRIALSLPVSSLLET